MDIEEKLARLKHRRGECTAELCAYCKGTKVMSITINAAARLKADAAHSEWFDTLSPAQQEQYLKLHPNSKMAKDAVAEEQQKPKKAHAPDFHHNKHRSVEHKQHALSGPALAPGSPARSKLADLIKRKSHGFIKAMHHQAKEFHEAGKALKALAGHRGNASKLSPDEQKAIKTACINVAMVVGGTALGGHIGLSLVASHFAKDFLMEAAKDSALYAKVQASVKLTAEKTPEQLMEIMIKKFAEYVKNNPEMQKILEEAEANQAKEKK